MKVPMQWLHDFIVTGLSAQELAHRMTMAGLEAEKIETIGAIWDKVYVGHVEKVERHPNADRLVLAEVDAGEHHLTVVTGAPNIAEGQKVALALAGARLYDGHSDSKELKTLKPGAIRGVVSEGMVCSEKELGMSDEHEGILVLNENAPVGAPLSDYLGDEIIEFEITPNLAHAFSIYGIAREAHALTGAPLTVPAGADLGNAPAGAPDLVTIENTALCPRYGAVVFDGIEVGPSPEWLARRLTAAGMRPINNIVDVTNYVMHETGQPLHAFDADTLVGGRIVVRTARDGETLETLDHQVRELTPDMLVIADAERPVALAGVMGGLHTEVSGGTTRILLEGANFDMLSVRHTSRDLKLRSEASARFERGVDSNLVESALARATKLIQELCQGATVTAYVDVYPEPVEPRELTMPLWKFDRVLGVSLGLDPIFEALDRLEFNPSIENEALTVRIPTYRRDVTIPVDIVEEAARIVGYDLLPPTLPIGQTAPVVRDPMYLLRRSVRAILAATGVSEAITYILQTPEMLSEFTTEHAIGFAASAPGKDLLRVKNPLQADRDILRPTLVPSLLESVANNLKHTTDVRLAELARVYLPSEADALPVETEMLAIGMSGRTEAGLYGEARELDYFDLKGAVDVLFERLGLAIVYQPSEHPSLQPGRAAVAAAGDRPIGRLGELRPDVAATFGIEEGRVMVGEFDLNAMLSLLPSGVREVKAARFLPVDQDFAIVVDDNMPAADIEQALRFGAGPLVTSIELFDVFRGAQIGEGKKSLAYRVRFTAPDRALTDVDIQKFRPKIEKSLKRVGGSLRT